MAAITTAVVVGAGALMTYYGQQEQAKAAQRAGELNAEQSEKNAQLAAQRAAEDERQFRLSFRRDNARNVVAVAASGVKMEGSPLEVLQDNASMMERDANNIRAGGQQQVDAYRFQGKMYREGGDAAQRVGQIQGAATLLNGASNTYSAGSKSGAWG